MPLNLVLGLHMLLGNPKPSVASFETSLIIFHTIASTTQSLPCEAKVDKTHKGNLFFFARVRIRGRVCLMVNGRVVLYLTSRLTSLQFTSLSFTLQ